MVLFDKELFDASDKSDRVTTKKKIATIEAENKVKV